MRNLGRLRPESPPGAAITSKVAVAVKLNWPGTPSGSPLGCWFVGFIVGFLGFRRLRWSCLAQRQPQLGHQSELLGPLPKLRFPIQSASRIFIGERRRVIDEACRLGARLFGRV